MDVSDPITNYQDSTWSITMISGNGVPAGGKIRIDLPD
jgi:hypothetical protein